MDLFELIKVVLRRWKLVVPVLVATFGLALFVQSAVPPEYEATGWLQWETPETARVEEAAGVIDPVQLSEGVQAPEDASFSVSPLEGQNFTISGTADSSDLAERAVEEALASIEARLAASQEDNGVPVEEQVAIRRALPETLVEAREDGTFLASASLFLYSPSGVSSNPYQANESTGRILQVAVMGDAGQRRFAAMVGPGVTFEVGQESRDAAALLQVVTRGSDQARVVSAFSAVVTLLNDDLDARQARAGVVPSQRISLAVLDAPLGAVDVSPPVNRATAGIVALGGLLALGLALGLEGLARRRSARDGGAEGAAEPTPAGPTAAPAPPRAPDGPGSGPSLAAGTDDGADRAADLPVPAVPVVAVEPTTVVAAPDDHSLPAGGQISRQTVHVATDDGGMEAYLAMPADGGGPGVIVIQDWWGVDGQVRDVADGLASAGFVALAPDLFGGATTHDLGQVDRFLQSLSVDRAGADLSAALDFLEGHQAVVGPSVGAIGFGMGGGLALVLGAREGDRVGAIVPYYAVGAYEEVALDTLTGSVLGHFGARDDVVTPDQVRRLEAELEASGATTVFLRIHEGARHAFFDDGDYFGTHDPGLAAATWEQSVAFLQDCLARSKSVVE